MNSMADLMGLTGFPGIYYNRKITVASLAIVKYAALKS